MSFRDIFRKSFLEGFTASQMSVRSMVLTIAITCLFSGYIFFTYRVATRKTFYDKNMDTSLAVIPVIVCAIVLAMQSSLVVSLGMVGALSIVRFRTAIKNPLDLVFLFWSISVGIICGAGIPGLALLLSVVITLGLFVIHLIPAAKAPVLLLVNASSPSAKDTILEKVRENTYFWTVKSQTIEADKLSLIFEVREKRSGNLLGSVSAVEGVVRCSLVNHDGEVTF